MKKVAIGLIMAVVLGSVGYTSYKLVNFAKSKSDNKIISEKIENEKTVQSDATPSTEKEVENSNEKPPENTQNNSESSSSDSGNIVFNSTDKSKGLDFSSSDAFILSYNTLIDEVGSDVKKEDMYSSESRARMILSSVGNVVVEAYQFDGQISRVIIKGKDLTKEIEGYLGGNAKVKYEDGNTIIHSIKYN